MFFTRTDPEIRARVQKGVALLDKEVPDWKERIDPGTLNVAASNSCILGQLFGDYFVGVAKLGLSGTQTRALGFYNITDEAIQEYQKLTKEWRLASSA